MNDTSAAFADRYRDMFKKLSPVERLKMGCRMFHTSTELVRASVSREIGDGVIDDPVEIRRRVFLRLYGGDFPPQKLEAIVTALRMSERK